MIALLDHKQGGTTDGETYSLPAVNATSADYIVVVWSRYQGGSLAALSDNLGNSYTTILSDIYTAQGFELYISVCAAPTVSASLVVTLTGSAIYASAIVSAYSGVSATSTLDVSATAEGAGTGGRNAGTVSPTVNDDLVLAVWSNTTAGYFGTSVNASFAVIESFNDVSGWCPHIYVAGLIQTTAASVSPTLTYSSARNNITMLAALKKAVASSLPTLSSPTYKPGTLTSVGFQPRVTAS